MANKKGQVLVTTFPPQDCGHLPAIPVPTKALGPLQVEKHHASALASLGHQKPALAAGPKHPSLAPSTSPGSSLQAASAKYEQKRKLNRLEFNF